MSSKKTRAMRKLMGESSKETRAMGQGEEEEEPMAKKPMAEGHR